MGISGGLNAMGEEHLQPQRGWNWIRDQEKLTSSEAEHLKACSLCCDWFTMFTNLARDAGFPLHEDIVPVQGEKPSSEASH